MHLYSQITKVYALEGMCSDGILIYPLPFSLTDIVGLGGAATVTMIVTAVNILDGIHSQTLQSDDRGFQCSCGARGATHVACFLLNDV